MRIELVKDESNHTAGWTIIGENEDEKRTLGSMRNLLFWGLKENVVEYDGMSADPDDPNYVAKLHFATRGYTASKKAERRE
jgi:hypothetical protein